MSIDAMKQALADAQRDERHLTVAETRYWCNQYKLLAQQAITALRAAIEQEPVAWHNPDCEGECIACLIEREVQSAYGTQGLDYLRRHVTARAIEAKLKEKNS